MAAMTALAARADAGAMIADWKLTLQIELNNLAISVVFRSKRILFD
jgi:hypothetical protein